MRFDLLEILFDVLNRDVRAQQFASVFPVALLTKHERLQQKIKLFWNYNTVQSNDY